MSFLMTMSYFAPLLSGVLAGTILVVGGGTAWNDIARVPDSWSYGGVVVLGMLLPLGFMAFELSRRMGSGTQKAGPGVSAWCQRAYKILKRVGPVLLLCYGISFVESALVLLSLERTALRQPSGGLPIAFGWQLPLWASLSLFFGVFLGLALQGRSSVASEG